LLSNENGSAQTRTLSDARARVAAAGQVERLRATVSLAESEAKHMRARIERAERLAAQAHEHTPWRVPYTYDMARAEAQRLAVQARVAAADGAGWATGIAVCAHCD
jgi:hypothetical protein